MASARLKAEAANGRARVNLERASILLVDDNLGLEILGQIFYGFGARTLHRSRSLDEAKEVIGDRTLDLIIIEAQFGEADAYEMVRVVRSGECGEANRFTPVIVLSAHTASTKVMSARDCGANFFVAKPISPKVIMDRLLWVAREKRQYLEAPSYIGPDRRFRDDPLPAGAGGRRRGDRPAPLTVLEEPPQA